MLKKKKKEIILKQKYQREMVAGGNKEAAPSLDWNQNSDRSALTELFQLPLIYHNYDPQSLPDMIPFKAGHWKGKLIMLGFGHEWR